MICRLSIPRWETRFTISALRSRAEQPKSSNKAVQCKAQAQHRTNHSVRRPARELTHICCGSKSDDWAKSATSALPLKPTFFGRVSTSETCLPEAGITWGEPQRNGRSTSSSRSFSYVIRIVGAGSAIFNAISRDDSTPSISRNVPKPCCDGSTSQEGYSITSSTVASSFAGILSTSAGRCLEIDNEFELRRRFDRQACASNASTTPTALTPGEKSAYRSLVSAICKPPLHLQVPPAE